MRPGATAALLLVLALAPQPSAPQESQADPLRGTWKAVTLDLAETDASQALAAVYKQVFASPPDLLGGSGKKFALKLKDVPFWEAVERICALDGGLLVQTEREGRIGPGKSADPVWIHGPLRLSVTEVSRVREVVYPERADRTNLVLDHLWAPDSHLGSGDRRSLRDEYGDSGRISILRAEDDTGKSLLPLVPEVGSFDRHGRMIWRNRKEWVFPLQPAAAEAKTIARLEGEWEGAFLGDFEEVVIDKPGKAFERQIGPIRLTSAMKVDGGSTWLSVDLAYDEASASDEWKRLLDAVLVHRLLVPAAFGRDDRSYALKPWGQSRHHAGFALMERPEDRFPLKEIPKTPLTLRLAKSLRTAKLPFSLSGIELPKGNP